MLGLFDSGLGGLTVVRRVRDLLPSEDLLFFADQAHVPYGDRDPHELAGLLEQNVRWLNRCGASAIVMACNTSCAIASQFGWPRSAIPILDLIDSAARAAKELDYDRIGVIATSATVRSGGYGKAIRRLNPEATVEEVAAPELVPLVEAGEIGGERARRAVARACEKFSSSIQALILACTHYPVLDRHFADALGERVVRIDPAVVQARRAVDLVRTTRRQDGGMGNVRYVTNGDLQAFRSSVMALMGELAPDVESVATAA
ncbi:MAG: glutamate racemase [Candidatus Eremiobacteraeota bacterium]|nr:glutamate racemase [Candidatus Eremiobacteraeota bacterium]